MRTPSSLFALACLIGVAGSQISAQEARELTIETSEQDPHLWLEEVEGEAALAWVQEQNTRSLDGLTGDERYARLEADALDIVNSTDRIAYGTIRNGQVYNFWQDEDNVRGLWRRTSLESYGTDAPDWETVIDFDALSASEDANWVFKGSNCYTPEGSSETRCLISLSDGGKDAVIQREFDLTAKTWVEDGFITPEAKQNASWLDTDTLLIGTDWGGDGSTLTESGYASIVKRWTRGTPLESATTLVEASPTDVWLAPIVIELEDGGRIGGALRGDTFFTRTYFLFDAEGQATEMPLPPRASIEDVYKGQLLVSLQQDWTPEGQSTEFESGDLISFDLAAYLETSTLPTAQLVFRPNARQSFEGVSTSGATALISINDNVVGKLLKLSRSGDDWETDAIELPGQGQTRLVFADRKADTAFINYEGFLTPDTLLAYDTGTGDLSAIKSAPEKFDASGLVVEQFESTSADGTKVPYFVVHREDIPLDGTTPTLLYAYGGFQISLAPSYSSITGKLWLENGGAYVLANIRGGGEFGPEWHQAGLKGNRQRIYDDFISVGEDLIARKITSPRHLGIMGGSNGGLLMGVMLNQRPDLWNAVVVQVPLLDMLRYHKLLAGASWIDEYGDPDIAEERAFLEQISPYHNFDPEAAYPIPFFLTSTKDDRVHPGHARKMAKLFEETDKPFYYYENIDGGHSAAANQTERARRSALEFMYLTQALRP
ncbi:MAG: prolyl oligopeptidase family serine peptidase [Hyphomonadaceae bacterium]